MPVHLDPSVGKLKRELGLVELQPHRDASKREAPRRRGISVHRYALGQQLAALRGGKVGGALLLSGIQRGGPASLVPSLCAGLCPYTNGRVIGTLTAFLYQPTEIRT
jgi:hypothetical protein